MTVALATVSLTACGPQAFVPSTLSSNQSAAGNLNIPPKVDIVMGISSGGTMKSIFPGLQQQIPAFVAGLQAQGWDYRFVTIPLSEYMPGSNYNITNAVSVSQYDTNTPQSQWLPAFPGASYTDPALKMLSSLFSPIFVFPGVLDPAHNDGHETGLQNESDFLNRSDVHSNFLRSDALLAVITLSNGDDRSGGTWKCKFDPNTNTWPSTCASYNVAWFDSTGTINGGYITPSLENSLRNVKTSPLLLKYYSLVAHNATTCMGYGDWSGLRYETLASDLGGIAQDICTTPITSALSAITQNLVTQSLSFEKNYLVIASDANVATIKVTKVSGGVSQALVQSSTNGWTYAGYVTEYTIDSPVPMAQATGYMIELHGAAKLHGNDTANVQYQTSGSVVTH